MSYMYPGAAAISRAFKQLCTNVAGERRRGREREGERRRERAVKFLQSPFSHSAAAAACDISKTLAISFRFSFSVPESCRNTREGETPLLPGNFCSM